VGDFPFLIVQLANFMQTQPQPSESGWAELREAQLLTAERLSKTGLALAIDIGEANDIHPKNKQEVGRRLALAAQAIAYGQKLEYSGPIYESMKVEASAIRLQFRHVGRGLVAKGADKLTGFAIAGADHKFVWADAKIDGRSIVVSSPDVAAPKAVRYAWADNPICDLYNHDGLPASPFRTDASK
jgi:sialate O-acetylesterase